MQNNYTICSLLKVVLPSVAVDCFITYIMVCEDSDIFFNARQNKTQLGSVVSIT
nr:MAG TPA: hypothetical protein [Bacteriophage sp.]